MHYLDRRNFIKLSGLALGGLSTGLLANQSIASGFKKTLRLGFVGIGGRGSYHLDTALGITGVEIPAICDIDPENLYRAKRWIEESGQPSPRLYDKGPTALIRLCE